MIFIIHHCFCFVPGSLLPSREYWSSCFFFSSTTLFGLSPFLLVSSHDVPTLPLLFQFIQSLLTLQYGTHSTMYLPRTYNNNCLPNLEQICWEETLQTLGDPSTCSCSLPPLWWQCLKSTVAEIDQSAQWVIMLCDCGEAARHLIQFKMAHWLFCQWWLQIHLPFVPLHLHWCHNLKQFLCRCWYFCE